MNKTSLLAFVAAAAFGVSAHAQVITLIDAATNNGSFETPVAGKINFSLTTSNTAAIPYWALTAAPAGNVDSGVETDAGITQAGVRGAFQQPTSGVFNLVTSRAIAAGDTYTLVYYARNTNGGTAGASIDTLTTTFFSQAAPAPGAAYGYAPTAVLATGTATVANNAVGTANAFTQVTLTYVATAANVGGNIGISVTNAGPNYDGIDNFVLTVAPVPEPSTYALMFAGMGGLLLMFRVRRASIKA